MTVPKKIPLLDLKAQLAPIREEIHDAMQKVIECGAFINGPEVREFEADIEQYLKSPFAVGVSSGTEALVLSLWALGLKAGEHVVCPAFTYYATAGAIIKAGGVPVFCDIDPKTFNMDPNRLSDILKKSKNPIKVVIAVHLYGQPAEMDSILALGREHHLYVIEDNAQSFGSQYKNQFAGTLGNCGTLSFFPGKNLGAFGDAGMVLTGDKETAQKLRAFRNQGTEPKAKYDHVYLGTNGRLDTLQAAVLKVKLKYVQGWNEKRARHAEGYRERLRDCPTDLPLVPEGNTHVYHQFVLRSRDKPRIVKYLNECGIDSRTYYPKPLHLQTCFRFLDGHLGDYPVSERASKELFAIPCYPELTESALDYIADKIKKVLKEKRA